MGFLKLLLSVIVVLDATEAGQNTSMYFQRYPQSVDVLIGTFVTFECQAAGEVEKVRWEANGRSWNIRDPPPADLRITPQDNSPSIYSRTLRAEREYNNTQVRCVLTLKVSGQRICSDTAFLLVRDFLEVPESINVTLTTIVNFNCLPYFPHHKISWYINGTEISQLNSLDISLVEDTTLQIMAQLQFNNTAIFCSIKNTSITSPVALLLVQGEPGPVSELHITESNPESLLLSWTAPFSLDITDSHPDIWYSLFILTLASGSLLPCLDCHNVTNTFCNLSVTGLTQGMYEIHVVSANAYTVSTLSAQIPLYVKKVAMTEEQNLFNICANICPNATQSTTDHKQLVATSCTAVLLSGVGLGVMVGIILVAIPMGLVIISVVCCGSCCPKRNELKNTVLQCNPAYERCSPRNIPLNQRADIQQRQRELSSKDTINKTTQRNTATIECNPLQRIGGSREE